MKYNKAITFSFDDGHTVDRKLVEILNKYNLKCTFNLNSGTMTKYCGWRYNGREYFKLEPHEVQKLYAGHEIAAHGMNHHTLTDLSDDALDFEIKQDIKQLEELFNTKIKGFVYACGKYDARALDILKNCGIKYARKVQTTGSTRISAKDMLECEYSFCIPRCFNDESFFKTVEDFLNSEDDCVQILSLWGHSFDVDGVGAWDKMEEFCRMISGKEDILYGTNSEVFEYFGLTDTHNV